MKIGITNTKKIQKAEKIEKAKKVIAEKKKNSKKEVKKFRCPGSRSENSRFSGCKMTEYRRKTVDFEAVFEGTNHREAWTPEHAAGKFGSIAGGDAKCAAEFGQGWRFFAKSKGAWNHALSATGQDDKIAFVGLQVCI